MPSGVKYEKFCNLKDSIYPVKQKLNHQLTQLKEDIKKTRHLVAGEFLEIIKESFPPKGSLIEINEDDNKPSYLVNMIKSIEDPTQERYVMISLT